MKRIARKIAGLVWEIGQRRRLRNIRDFDPAHVIDIDNTLTVCGADGRINHFDPSPRENMVRYVKRLLEMERKVIFLSARDHRVYKATISWLASHGILQSRESVFLVRSAMHKIEYLKTLAQNNRNIEYVDDLSYNHENNDIRFYEAVIEEVRKLPITWRGLDFIETFGVNTPERQS